MLDNKDVCIMKMYCTSYENMIDTYIGFRLPTTKNVITFTYYVQTTCSLVRWNPLDLTIR